MSGICSSGSSEVEAFENWSAARYTMNSCAFDFIVSSGTANFIVIGAFICFRYSFAVSLSVNMPEPVRSV